MLYFWNMMLQGGRAGAGRASLLLVLAALSGGWLMAQSQPASQRPAASSPASEPEYLISAEDVLEIYVLDVPELSRQYEVSSTGQVTLPLLPEPLSAAGLTLNQFSQRVRSALQQGGFVSDPRVTTAVRESRAHAVAITGAVRRPQMYRVLGRTT
ncbi:MAG TPA: polysaccharide biosynthesis/export family protein, partial [Terriglobales bacterium]|nr:polysaccharide biosynthesis/export family protein [Terriglobales bacterium]